MRLRNNPSVTTMKRSAGIITFSLHAVCFIGLAVLSWRKWPDPLVDFGRELYVPWQITQGKVLHQDINSLFGPLSPYLNALWMRAFGVSLMTLAWCNMAILAVTLAAIHRLIRECTDRFTASWATLVALVLCGFSQYLEIGNYNFVTPYSHEATHGFALSVLTLAVVQHAMRTRRPVFGAAAGLAFGLSLLTKPELPLAVAGALCIGFAAFAVVEPSNRRRLFRTLLWFAVTTLLPPTLFFAYFRTRMDSLSAADAVVGAWISAFNSAVVRNQFYVVGMGADAPAFNTLLVCGTFLVITGFIAVIALLSTREQQPWSASGVLRRIATIALVALVPVAQLLPLALALPLIVLLTLSMITVAFWKSRRNHDRAIPLIGLMMWCSFALLLLAKIALNARLSHYGFYLALPAVTVTVILLCWVLPEHFERWEARIIRRTFRWRMSLVLAASILPPFGLSYWWYSTKTQPIGVGNDRFYVSQLTRRQEYRLVPRALEELARRTKPGDTVAVLPEGVMLNYLLRLESPLHVLILMPPEILTFGEADVVEALEAAPPTMIVFVHKDTSEYGYPLFGTSGDYGAATMDWIRKRYHPVQVIGMDPMNRSGYGLVIFEKT